MDEHGGAQPGHQSAHKNPRGCLWISLFGGKSPFSSRILPVHTCRVIRESEVFWEICTGNFATSRPANITGNLPGRLFTGKPPAVPSASLQHRSRYFDAASNAVRGVCLPDQHRSREHLSTESTREEWERETCWRSEPTVLPASPQSRNLAA